MTVTQRLLASCFGAALLPSPHNQRLLRRKLGRRLKMAWALTLSGGFASVVLAQNPSEQTNPFGGDPFGAATAPAAAPASPTNQDAEALDPLLYSIIKQDLSQPSQRVLAAETLFLLKRPNQANGLLAELTQPLAGREAYDFVFAVTSSRILWLQSQVELQPSAKSWLATTLSNAMQYSTTEESANQAIDDLLQGGDREQSTAREKLLAQGLTAATPLLQRMQGLIQRAELDSVPLRRLLQVIQAGPQEWDATLRSVVGSESEFESAAILGLAARHRSVLNQAAVIEWTARQPGGLPDPALAPVITHWQTMFASQHGFNPGTSELTRRWLEQLNQAEITQWDILQSPRNQLSSTTPTVWLWDSTLGGLTPQLDEPMDQSSRNHALLATAWLRVDAENEGALRNYVAAQFKRAKWLNGIDRPLPPAAGEVATQYLSPPEMSEMLLSALEQRQWLVAQALLESLQTAGDPRLLEPSAGRLSPVVMALKASDQRVRAAAVQTILTWKPEQNFGGVSYFNEGLREVFSTPLGTYAVVASMNPYHAAYLEGLVRSAGWNAAVASSAGQLMADVNTYPASFLIITDAMGDVPYVSVVDQVRATAKGRTLPILLLVRSENLNNARAMFQVDRNDPYTMIAPFSENGRDLLPWIERMSSLKEVTGQVPSRVALEQAERALTQISAWLNSDGARRLLDLPSFAGEARGLLGIAGGTDRSIIEILARYGDPETQIYLASVASDGTFSDEIRSAAAQGFRSSVQKFGTLMTSKQIETQYDRQNQSRNETPFTQAILNSILDTLEARTKRVPFAELPPVPGL